MGRAVGIMVCCATVLLNPAWGEPAAKKDVSAEFLETWQTAARNPDKSVSLWEKFARRHNAHDLGQLARLLSGIERLRRASDRTDLRIVLSRFRFEVPPKPAKPNATEPSQLRKHITAAGKGLTARVQMLQLGRKLQEYYRKHVEYPQTLDELGAEAVADAGGLVDPFGERFAYRPGARKLMPDLPRQTFTLRCVSIDAERRELRACLQRGAKPVTDLQLSFLKPEIHKAYVKRRRPDGAFGQAKKWAVGDRNGQRVLWVVYGRYVIGAWKQFPCVIVKPSPPAGRSSGRPQSGGDGPRGVQ